MTIYFVSAIVEGNAKTSPLGVVARFSNEYEQKIKSKHQLVRAAYVNEMLAGVSAVLFWTGEGVDAVSFLSEDDARTAFPAIKEFPAARLAEFNNTLVHFPR